MPQTTMSTDFLQALQIFTKLAVHAVCQHLGIFAIHNVALTIEEPCRNLVLGRVLDDGDDTLELFGCDFTSARCKQ